MKTKTLLTHGHSCNRPGFLRASAYFHANYNARPTATMPLTPVPPKPTFTTTPMPENLAGTKEMSLKSISLITLK
jgi:hypothetical protein